MPNWTQNTLEVEGTKEDCKKFLAHMGEEMDFNKVIPMPEEVDTREWSIENWGTKWNACDSEPVETHIYANGKSVTLTYKFNTAWDTPREVITALWEKWPDLEFFGGYVHECYEGCGSFQEFSNR
jgi:hypothetical protein